MIIRAPCDRADEEPVLGIRVGHREPTAAFVYTGKRCSVQVDTALHVVRGP